MAANSELFSILTSVDSTQKYATDKVRAGMAKNGSVFLSLEQTAGKGQRGKRWLGNKGENLYMSITIQPNRVFWGTPFLFSSMVAVQILKVLSNLTQEDFFIKWPNDIYHNDNKSAGILIENIYKGSDWQWAIVGVGVNVNQTTFDPSLKNPTSLKQITKRNYDLEDLGTSIAAAIDATNLTAKIEKAEEILATYNLNLYKRNQMVRLKKHTARFDTTVQSVDKFGRLHCTDAVDRTFEFGEVEWVPGDK